MASEYFALISLGVGGAIGCVSSVVASWFANQQKIKSEVEKEQIKLRQIKKEELYKLLIRYQNENWQFYIEMNSLLLGHMTREVYISQNKHTTASVEHYLVKTYADIKILVDLYFEEFQEQFMLVQKASDKMQQLQVFIFNDAINDTLKTESFDSYKIFREQNEILLKLIVSSN
ncbi:MAG: hypothetical protein ACRCXK_09245 [Wohlfahrtiimonas sp.]